MNDENEVQDIPETETLDFNQADYTFVPNTVHTWRQQGYYLVCKSCEIEHAVYVGHDKLLVGISNEGKPILKSRRELGMT